MSLSILNVALNLLAQVHLKASRIEVEGKQIARALLPCMITRCMRSSSCAPRRIRRDGSRSHRLLHHKDAPATLLAMLAFGGLGGARLPYVRARLAACTITACRISASDTRRVAASAYSIF